jgi:Tol biopolymer transport system component
VFERGGNLYAISADGSRTVRLTKTRIEEVEPAVSQDGSRIAFARWHEGGISTMNVDGTHRRIVTRGRDGGPTWAPDDQTIYFVRYQATLGGETCGSIFSVSATGKGVRRLTNTDSTRHSHQEPAVSPDGRRIAFSDWEGCAGGFASPRLRVIDTDGRPTRDLVKLRHNGYYPGPEHSSPAWSPDGRRLVFHRNSDLMVANRDGSDEHRIVRGNRTLGYEQLAWSPDGNWIAFSASSTPPSTAEFLLLVHPDGTGLHRIAQNQHDSYSVGGWLPNLPK